MRESFDPNLNLAMAVRTFRFAVYRKRSVNVVEGLEVLVKFAEARINTSKFEYNYYMC